MSAITTVLGAGSWGTALALQLARNGHHVRLWGHDPHEVEKLAAARVNQHYLPDCHFPDNLLPIADIDQALADTKLAVVVVPSFGFAQTLRNMRPSLPNDCVVAWATKGLEPKNARLLSDVVDEALDGRSAAVISGPTFAAEVGRSLPTAITSASKDPETADRVGAFLHGECFRVYTSTDIVGVQIGGVAKNVQAIAAGAADGLGFGANTRAALITRGLAEITRLAVALGGHTETLAGLSGLGDLALTCTDNQSRNRRLGLALAAGKSLQQATDEIGQVVEGAESAQEVVTLAARVGVEMPISEQVRKVLHEGMDPQVAVHNLLTRERRAE